METELPTIGCMILYKDELVHLKRLVPQVTEAFDEVVFVTNKEPSTDGSDEFLATHGIEPLRMKWVDSFAVARQFGLDRCTCDYTMWMDCDDDLVTECESWAEAKLQVKEFLASTPRNSYTHRVYFEDRKDYWTRVNWFHKDSGVKVKYPAHEVYLCDGPREDFPKGLIDRRNAPLRPDYKGKNWRYYEVLSRYLEEVDPRDARCKYYLAREIRGSHVAQMALYLDYLTQVQASEKYMNFSEEWASVFALYCMREHIPNRQLDWEQLKRIAQNMILRYPFEFAAQVLYCMVMCEKEPSEAIALRFHQVIHDRQKYRTGRAPNLRGWYYQRALNSCGYYLFKISVLTGSDELARLSVRTFEDALSTPEPMESASTLASNNLRMAEGWLSGFPPLESSDNEALIADSLSRLGDRLQEASD
ncbi:glycosyltransferase [Planctomycetota bacterium]